VKRCFDFQNLSLVRNYLLPKIFWDLEGKLGECVSSWTALRNNLKRTHLLSNFVFDLSLKIFSNHVLHFRPYLFLDSLPDSLFEREAQILDLGLLQCYLFFPSRFNLLDLKYIQ
jgi:hypothetical protein